VDADAALFELGRRINELRGAAGLTQEQLAERVAIDAKDLQKIEAGEVNITFRTLVRLAAGLGCTLAELVAPPTSRAVKVGRPQRKKAAPPARDE
jgi:transcriptional regulator with XRE-family HTH domain